MLIKKLPDGLFVGVVNIEPRLAHPATKVSDCANVGCAGMGGIAVFGQILGKRRNIWR
jgi:hypothetical protein